MTSWICLTLLFRYIGAISSKSEKVIEKSAKMIFLRTIVDKNDHLLVFDQYVIDIWLIRHLYMMNISSIFDENINLFNLAQFNNWIYNWMISAKFSNFFYKQRLGPSAHLKAFVSGLDLGRKTRADNFCRSGLLKTTLIKMALSSFHYKSMQLALSFIIFPFMFNFQRDTTCIFPWMVNSVFLLQITYFYCKNFIRGIVLFFNLHFEDHP